MNLPQAYGLLRSLLTYYLPGRIRAFSRLYSQFIRPGDLCFDLGAHVGSRLRAMLRCGADVVALEPHPLFARLLTRLYPQAQVLELAVAAASGSRKLRFSQTHPTIASISPEWIDRVRKQPSFTRVRWAEGKVVETVSLDTLIERYGMPAFIKMDIEGSEPEALRGLSRPVRALSFEFLPGMLDETHQCLDLLGELGQYEYNLTVGESGRWRSRAWTGPAELSALLELPSRPGEVYARLRGAG